MKKKLLVIGAVAAGTSAAAKARRQDPEMEIKVYAEGEYISYGGCGLPYFVGGRIDKKEKLLARSIEEFAQQGIEVKALTRAINIDTEQGKVSFLNLSSGHCFEEAYDNLVIATGARPYKPDLPGVDLKGIFNLRTINDGLNIKNYLHQYQPRRAIIIGGGYIGLEMVENLMQYGCQIILLERGRQIIPNMDEDMAGIVQQYLESKGVEVHTDEIIREFGGTQLVSELHSNKGRTPVEFVLMSVGVQPNSEIAAQAGIELGINQAIRINDRMETNIQGIYSAGDCAVVNHLLSGEEVYIPMGTTANKQGKVAGENAAGGNAVFKGVLGTGIARVMEMEIARTGFCEKECLRRGIEYISHTIKGRTAAHYCPASGDIWVKLIMEKNTRRLLGGQIVGYNGAGKRIDVLATAITTGATVDEIIEMDLAYSPPFSPVWDPVLVALNQF
ncbi:MAG: CoA-disulfide reductase [Syntrophomonadaceae bacterium]|nr:CoA-disulfide reductase [Syntrophomonadaceae bacterium]